MDNTIPLPAAGRSAFSGLPPDSVLTAPGALVAPTSDRQAPAGGHTGPSPSDKISCARSVAPQRGDAAWIGLPDAAPGSNPDEDDSFLQAGGISLPPLLITLGSPKAFTWSFFSWDHLGSIRLIADGIGTQVWTTKYLPYGEEIPDPSRPYTGNSRRFTDHERDQETGLDYMKARYFDTKAAAFLSNDPLVNRPSGAQGRNLYTYVLRNPVRLTDPSGLSAVGGSRVLAPILSGCLTCDHVGHKGFIKGGQFFREVKVTTTTTSVRSGGSTTHTTSHTIHATSAQLRSYSLQAMKDLMTSTTAAIRQYGPEAVMASLQLDPQQVNDLAGVVAGECADCQGSDADVARLAIAMTVLNRMADSGYTSVSSMLADHPAWFAAPTQPVGQAYVPSYAAAIAALSHPDMTGGMDHMYMRRLGRQHLPSWAPQQTGWVLSSQSRSLTSLSMGGEFELILWNLLPDRAR
jgi:RHS repeat-associated protein